MKFNPDDVGALPPGVHLPCDLAGEWVVAQVRGGFERRIVAFIADAGAGYFLPIRDVTRRDAAGKKRVVKELLFPTYLFACCRHEDDRYELVARDGVLRIINVRDQARLTRELTGFAVAIEHGLLGDVYADMKLGVKCKIIRGGLRGQQGWIDRREKGDCVLLTVTILGAERPVNVPIEDVELM